MNPHEQLILAAAIILACILCLLLALCRTSKAQPWFHRCPYCFMLTGYPGLCRRCAERRERDEAAAMRIYEAALSEKSKPQGGKLAIGTHHRAASEFRRRRSN